MTKHAHCLRSEYKHSSHSALILQFVDVLCLGCQYVVLILHATRHVVYHVRCRQMDLPVCDHKC